MRIGEFCSGLSRAIEKKAPLVLEPRWNFLPPLASIDCRETILPSIFFRGTMSKFPSFWYLSPYEKIFFLTAYGCWETNGASGRVWHAMRDNSACLAYSFSCSIRVWAFLALAWATKALYSLSDMDLLRLSLLKCHEIAAPLRQFWHQPAGHPSKKRQ